MTATNVPALILRGIVLVTLRGSPFIRALLHTHLIIRKIYLSHSMVFTALRWQKEKGRDTMMTILPLMEMDVTPDMVSIPHPQCTLRTSGHPRIVLIIINASVRLPTSIETAPCMTVSATWTENENGSMNAKFVTANGIGSTAETAEIFQDLKF
jgi:hypothetical protein